MGSKAKRHIVIPDTQVRPDVSTRHLAPIGRYIADWQPDVIVHLGDHWDMPSLSSYDRGTIGFEGRRYRKDIAAGNRGLQDLTDPINEAIKRSKGKWKPRMILLRGNHEQRIERAVSASPELEGAIGYEDFNDVELGWKPIPFLQPIVIDGVAYCHYFCQSANGNVTNSKRGAPSARAQVQRLMMSATAGHKQGLDVHIQTTPAGLRRGVIAGSCYLHDENYLSPQGNHYWRGILVKHEVRQGQYDLMEVSLKYLLRRYN